MGAEWASGMFVGFAAASDIVLVTESLGGIDQGWLIDRPADGPRTEFPVRNLALLPEHTARRSRKYWCARTRQIGGEHQYPSFAKLPANENRALGQHVVPSGRAHGG